MMRLLCAFIVAACGMPVLLFACGGDNAADLAATTATITVTATLLFGGPAFVYYRRRAWWELWRYQCGGGIAGALCAPFFGDGSALGMEFMLLFFTLGGIAHASLFWAVAIWGNDKLTRPTQFRLPCGTAYRYAPDFLHSRNSPSQSLTGRCWRHTQPS